MLKEIKTLESINLNAGTKIKHQDVSALMQSLKIRKMLAKIMLLVQFVT